MTQAATLPDADQSFLIEEFLAVEREKSLLRFNTAGSVDDGKSTLIGRLLYDSRNVYEDQVRAVTRTQLGHTQPAIDFAQLTDGLRAEREQGITIDVAYRYFSTQRRKFIIADTPGHEQYTRNMATGASTADLAVILIDARKGILTQSRRHAYIASLLGIPHLVAAINKMDLVDFSEEVFRSIEREFQELASKLGRRSLQTIPVSALEGDNVVTCSDRMPWYEGTTLLEHLETVPVQDQEGERPFRLPVQRVIRPGHHYRGFAGQISSGTVRPGDVVVALPSGRSTRVASITAFEGDLDVATAPFSVAITLEDELDISRGDLLAAADRVPHQASRLEASLVWFDRERSESHQPYLLKHGTHTTRARIQSVRSRINVETFEAEAAGTLAMNDIGLVEIETARPLFFDPYEESRAGGSFILIDLRTNATAAAGMIRRGLPEGPGAKARHAQPAVVLMSSSAVADLVEETLLREEVPVVRTKVQSESTWNALLAAGVVTLVQSPQEHHAVGSRIGIADNALHSKIRWKSLGSFGTQSAAEEASAILKELYRSHVFAQREAQP
jgi:sulfate adenylyltransferase large subunit